MKEVNDSIFFCLCACCYFISAIWMWIGVPSNGLFWLYPLVILVVSFLVTFITTLIVFKMKKEDVNYWESLKNSYIWVMTAVVLLIFIYSCIMINNE
ncbi:MAG: hypothetical protein K5659_03715 [Lachnospiraceae bacterium]|nr:hypothetical protein [Lachnospiraceae bacterium]